MDRVEIDIMIINKQIKKYREAQALIGKLALSNKTLVQTRDGLLAIKAVLEEGKKDENN